jgi:uncharacterized membrane protein HdeD (DUF308 family)
MRIIGIILIVLGVLALAYQGITYTQHKHHDVLGIVDVETTQKKTIPVQPIIGALVLVAGVVMVIADSKSRA